MLVWIVNPFDNLPSEGYRPQRFWLMSRAFVAAGHEVTYWTSSFSHATKAPRKFVENFPDPGFRVVSVPEPAYRSNVSPQRMYAHWRWAKNWSRSAYQEGEHPDLIVVSSPPLFIGREVRRYARSVGAKVVTDIMDDWPGTFARLVPRLFLAPLFSLARKNCRGSDFITVVADRYADLVRHLGYRGRIVRFYHGITLAPAIKLPDSSASRLHLVYVGNMGRTYDLLTIVHTLELLPDAMLDVAGAGEQLEAVRSLAERIAPGRVTLHGYLDNAALLQLLSKSDVGIVPMQANSCVGVPYKFADYSAASLAIVSSLSGESAGLLTRYNAGAVYEWGNAESLAAVLRSLLPHLNEIRANSRKMAECEFDAARIYAEYVSTISSIVNGERS